MDVPDLPEIDPNFEPQLRARSNTWPLRPNPSPEHPNVPSPSSTTDEKEGDQGKGDPLGLAAKKTSSRRNAWGNLSYADLITKAIQSSPDQRLTLSQVYDWMVQNVPYFKDKGDSNSSAGWKNSIRHNLSLHNRFMRIQNEGTGKSSWWVINPDAKPGKTPRRRSGSMETKASEKKKIRVRQKMEALRAAREGQLVSSTSSLNETDFLTLDSFSEFRARTSSNASSIGGRLSPIHSGMENHESLTDLSSPLPWSNDGMTGFQKGDSGYSEHLADGLADLYVNEQLNALSPDPNLNRTSLSTPSPLPLQVQLSPHGLQHGYSDQLRAPPSYQFSTVHYMADHKCRKVMLSKNKYSPYPQSPQEKGLRGYSNQRPASAPPASYQHCYNHDWSYNHNWILWESAHHQQLRLNGMSPVHGGQQAMEQDPSPGSLNHSPYSNGPNSPADLRDLHDLQTMYQGPQGQQSPGQQTSAIQQHPSQQPQTTQNSHLTSPQGIQQQYPALNSSLTAPVLDRDSLQSALSGMGGQQSALTGHGGLAESISSSISGNLNGIGSLAALGSVSGYTNFTKNTNLRAMTGGGSYTPNNTPGNGATPGGNSSVSYSTNSLLRQALTAKEQRSRCHSAAAAQGVLYQQSTLQSLLRAGGDNGLTQPMTNGHGTGTGTGTSSPLPTYSYNPLSNHAAHPGVYHHQQHFPQDIDFSLINSLGENLDCDMEQVISHELVYGGNLDFDGPLENNSTPASTHENSNAGYAMQTLDSR